MIKCIILKADCNPESIVFRKHVNEINYTPVLNVLLIKDSLGIHNICVLKKTSLKEAKFAFWVKIIS